MNTNKIDLIKAEVERLFNHVKDSNFESDSGAFYYLKDLLDFIDSLQEEPCNSCQGFNDKDKCDELVFTHNCPIVKNPVSIWHDASEKSNEPEEVVIINPSDNTGDVLTRCTGVYQGRIWAYTSELLNLDNSCNIGKNLEEEPVSEDLKEVARRYAALQAGMKDAMTSEFYEEYPYSPNDVNAFKAGANWGRNQAMAEIQAQSMALAHGCPKEPVNEELEEAVNAYIGYAPEVDESSSTYGKRQAFKAGAKWKEEQFEKNRIKHCDDITEEQYNLETGFVDLYIKRFNRLPTILDAIEYGKTLGEMLMIGEAVETTFNVSLPSSLYVKLKAKGCEDGDKLLIIKKEN